MDVLSVGFVVLIVLLSGFIAFGADELGRRLGKKRLSMGGMRPKHTATVITVVAGMLTSITAIVMLGLLSAPVRVWLIEGRITQQRLQEARAELETVRVELEGQRARVQEADLRLADVQERLASEQERLKLEQAKVLEATQRAETLRRESARLAAEVREFRGRLRDATQRLDLVRAEFNEMQKQVRALDINNEQLVRNNQELAQQNLRLHNEVLSGERQVKELQTQIESQTGRITVLSSELQAIQEQSDVSLQRFDEEIRAAQTALEQARTEAERAEQDLSILRANNLFQLLTSRTARLVVNVGDELARVSVRGGVTSAEARNFVLALLEQSSQRATALGVRPSSPQEDAARLVELETRDGARIPPDAQVGEVVQMLSASTSPHVVIARSAVNTFSGEYVPIALVVRPNPLVYRAGQVIAEMRVDGSLDEQATAIQISEFVTNQLSQKAVQDGMIPAIGHDMPLGVIEPGALISTIQTIRSSGRTMRLQFASQQDTRAGDRVRLELRLR